MHLDDINEDGINFQGAVLFYQKLEHPALHHSLPLPAHGNFSLHLLPIDLMFLLICLFLVALSNLLHFDLCSFSKIEAWEFSHGLPNLGLEAQPWSSNFTFMIADHSNSSSFYALRKNFYFNLKLTMLFVVRGFFFFLLWLTQEIQGRIVRYLIFNPRSSDKELSNFKTPSFLTYLTQ